MSPKEDSGWHPTGCRVLGPCIWVDVADGALPVHCVPAEQRQIGNSSQPQKATELAVKLFDHMV